MPINSRTQFEATFELTFVRLLDWPKRLLRSLADRVTRAGCVFVGAGAGTAFGDYVAGSNHILPTGGAARFSGPLGVSTFRRRMSVVEVSAGAAANLAEATDQIARAEGLPVHGESAKARADQKDSDLQVT